MEISHKLRASEERKQSVTRILISIVTFTVLAAFNLVRGEVLSHNAVQGLSIILAHTLFSLAWYGLVKRHPRGWPPRIYVAMVIDVTITTLAFHFAARYGGFFYPVYLWVIVGYGLRYGKRTLFAAAFLGFAEFSFLIKFNAYWQDSSLMGLGLWWGILILPMFFLTVLNRLSALNQKLGVELIRSKAAEKAKGEFLANMSHEIRTPLNGVLGMVQILEDVEIDAEGRKHLDILHRSAESLLDIVNDILDFSKITAGKMNIETVPLDLRRILNDVEQILRPAAVAKGLSIDVHYPEFAPAGFLGDPIRIRQIVLNLAANAVKFTALGGIDLTVSIADGGQNHSEIEVLVTDTGIGIPADRLRTVFDQFEQVDGTTSRNFGGTGLGLAISRRLARMMGGDLQVRSEPGWGSVFTVTLTLPHAQVAAEAAPQKDELPQFCLQVLVAEDNNINQVVIKKLLQKIGIEPVFAANGREAIAKLESGHFDLVFMDVRMPVLDGLDATRLIRARDDALADIPIVALTADADSDSARRCLEAGMNAHLGKPVILAQAVAAIERLKLPVTI